MSERFDYRVSRGVALLQLDNPPVNSLSSVQRRTLYAQLQHAAAREDVRAIVLVGARGSFCGGAEIKEFNTPLQAEFPRMPELIEGCDAIGKLLVAAIDGFAYGAGLELALAFHYRVATPGAMLGLPEIKFGFLPGAGGSQRLPRLVPMADAARMMLNGQGITAQVAHELGLVDDLAVGDLVEAAIAFAEGLLERGAPLRRTRDLRPRVDKLPEGFFDELKTRIATREKGHAAKLHVVDCCLDASTQPFDEGLRRERERFLTMLDTPESKALRHIFFAERKAAKAPASANGAKPRAVRRVAVVGAGTMGRGIAMSFINAGIPVTLIDAVPEGLARGMKAINQTYAAAVQKGRMTQAEMDRVVSLVTPSLELIVASEVDVVVEAVFERLDLKIAVFKQLDALVGEDAILATNTSMLDVNAIAAATKRPERVIGMHFFSPAHIMRLLEVVQCEKTNETTVATTMQLARTLGKVPVLSGVCDGFIGNRMLQKYLQQSLFLLDEGCTPQQIDGALEAFGMAMGPFAVGDLSGLDIGWAIRKRRYVENPEMVYSRVADRICEAGRFGQKSGKGWYRYESGSRTPLPDPEVDAILTAYRSEIGVPKRSIDDEEIVTRLMFALVNEGANILEEKIAQRASDIDVVYTTGYGFPPTRGGPMFYANKFGVENVLAAMSEFRRGYQGEQWQPSRLLVELAQRGKAFE